MQSESLASADEASGGRPAAGTGDDGISPLVLIAIGLVVSLLVLLVRFAGGLEPVELSAYDQSIRWRTGGLEPAAEVAVIGFDDADLARWSWPVPDNVLNQVIGNAFAAGASVVAIDIYRDVGVAPGSDDLNRTFRDNMNVVAATKHPSADGESVPPPQSIKSDQVGFTDMVLDADGFVRRGLLYLGHDGLVQTSLSLQAARLHLKRAGIVPGPIGENDRDLRLGEAIIRPLTPEFGGYHKIDAAGYQFALDYRRPPWQITVAASRDVFDGKTDTDALSGKIVLIGVTSQQVKDHFILPVQGGDTQRATFGVVLHAMAVDQILRMSAGDTMPVQALDGWLEAALVLAAAGLVLLAIAGRKRPLFYILAGIGTALVCLLGGYVGLLYDWWLPSVPLAITTLLTAFSVLSWRALLDRRERVALARLLTSQVSPQVARELWENRRTILKGVKPRPTRLTATVLFVDLAGSTSVADQLAPDHLVQWVSAFLEDMAEAVLQSNGVVETFTGDGLMAVFGVPVPRTQRSEMQRDALNAVECALQMGRRLEALNGRIDRNVLPEMSCRIGIHSGILSAGNVGTRSRMHYTVIGQTANLAARLEGFGKDDPNIACDSDGNPLNCRILLSEATVELLPQEYNVQSMGELELRGAQAPMIVYRLLDAERT